MEIDSEYFLPFVIHPNEQSWYNVTVQLKIMLNNMCQTKNWKENKIKILTMEICTLQRLFNYGVLV